MSIAGAAVQITSPLYPAFVFTVAFGFSGRAASFVPFFTNTSLSAKLTTPSPALYVTTTESAGVGCCGSVGLFDPFLYTYSFCVTVKLESSANVIFNVPSVGFNTSFAVVLLGSVMSSTFFAAWIAASTAAFFVLSVIVDLATTPFFQKSESSVSPTHAARSFPSMPPFSVTVSAVVFFLAVAVTVVSCWIPFVLSIAGAAVQITSPLYPAFVFTVAFGFSGRAASFVPFFTNTSLSAKLTTPSPALYVTTTESAGVGCCGSVGLFDPFLYTYSFCVTVKLESSANVIFNVPSVGFNTSFAVVLLGSVMSSTFFAAWIAASTAAFFVLSVIVDLATTPFFQKSESSVSPTHAARSFPSMPPFSVTVSAVVFFAAVAVTVVSCWIPFALSIAGFAVQITSPLYPAAVSTVAFGFSGKSASFVPFFTNTSLLAKFCTPVPALYVTTTESVGFG